MIQVKEEKEYASKGVAGSGLGLGIAGTALALLQGNNGLNLFGNREQVESKECSQLRMENASLRAEKYADNVGINVYQQHKADLNNQVERLLDKYISPLATESSSNIARMAAMEEQIKCMQKEIDYKDAAIKQELTAAIALESERRKCGDENIYAYVNATFVPGKLVMPKDRICPDVMDRYNAWTAPTNA